MAEQTVGIIGFGNIGRLLQHKLAGLGCKTFLLYDPYVAKDARLPDGARLVEFDDVLQQSDLISLHLPLLAETKHIIDSDRLNKIKKGAVLVNAARGGIVDEDALLSAIDTQDFMYVADTVEGEPQINPALLDHERVIVTPHIASLTEASERRMVTLALDNFLEARYGSLCPQRRLPSKPILW